MAKQPPGTPSPFQKLLELRRMREQAAAAGPDGSPAGQPDSQTVDPSSQPDSQMADQPTLTPAAGRMAKSADPDFTKFTVYVRRSTHRAAKLRAIGEGRELSEVVEDLLRRWASERS
jgi:hypothetical protein